LIGAYKNDRGGSDAGAVFVMPGDLTGSVNLSTASSVVEGWDPGGRASYDLMGGGDANGDGQIDLMIGAYAADGDGEAYLIYGPLTGIFDLATPDGSVVSASGNVRVGISVGFLTSPDGGLSDGLIVGSDKYDGASDNDVGQVLFFSSLSSVSDEGSATAKILGDQKSAVLGFAIDGTGDVTGDGLGDLLLSAEKYDDGSDRDVGAVYVMYGEFSGDLGISAADEMTIGPVGSRLGQALDLGPDVDDDGLDDVIIGGFDDDSTESNGGIAYLFTGALSGSADTTATATFLPTGADQHVGWSVRLGGDVNGDGIGDVLIGAPKFDGDAGNNSGAAFLFLGPLSGTYTLDDAAYGWEGVVSGSRAGSSVAFVPDLDGDGLDEVLIGAERADAASGDEGAAYLLLGGAL
jgi:hypothetical protein